DHLNSRNVSSFEEPVFNSGLKDVAYAASVDHKDGIVNLSKHTTIVDIVGRSCNSGSGPDKDVDVNSVTEGQMLNLCSEMSYVCVNTSNHANDEAPRAQNVRSPGFSKPPHGFPSGTRTEQLVSASSGRKLYEQFFVKQSLSRRAYKIQESNIRLGKRFSGVTDPVSNIDGIFHESGNYGFKGIQMENTMIFAWKNISMLLQLSKVEDEPAEANIPFVRSS
ncbi:hypothetical protein Tco_1514423, partial [Tanacetum coccineum]